MAEALLVKCKKCGLVFDKHRYPKCPVCEPRVRPGAAPPTGVAGAKGDGNPPRNGGPADGDETPKVRSESAMRLLAGLRRVAWVVCWMALGAAGSLAAWNHKAGSKTLMAMPEPPAVCDPSVVPAVDPKTPPVPVPASVVAAPGAPPPERAIDLTDARPGPAAEDGSRRYTLVLANRALNTARDLTVQGLGEDKKGNPVVTAETKIVPSLLGGGREATATVDAGPGVTLHEFRISGWIQHTANLRPAPPPEPQPERAAAATTRRPARPPDDQPSESPTSEPSR